MAWGTGPAEAAEAAPGESTLTGTAGGGLAVAGVEEPAEAPLMVVIPGRLGIVTSASRDSRPC